MVDHVATFIRRLSWYSGRLNLMEPYGLSRAAQGLLCNRKYILYCNLPKISLQGTFWRIRNGSGAKMKSDSVYLKLFFWKVGSTMLQIYPDIKHLSQRWSSWNWQTIFLKICIFLVELTTKTSLPESTFYYQFMSKSTESGMLTAASTKAMREQWRTEGVGGLGGSNPPPEFPKTLQTHAKLNPIVKTVKNCWI